MKRSGRLLATTLVGLTATAGLAMAAAPAYAEAETGTSSVEATTTAPSQDEVQALGLGECTEVLSASGYTVTWARTGWCAVGTVGTPNAVAACGAGLWSTGVKWWVAGAACAGAALP